MKIRQDWSVNACVLLFLYFASQIHCTKENDLIKNLPGQPNVSFKQYGGYVSVNEKAGRFLYYYFVEAIKPTNSTPLVIWFNGGPGSSSLGFGAFMELGPFRVHSDGKTLFSNPYSWNNEANVLFLESPVGVGFSYSNTPINLEEFGKQGDKLTTEENYVFLLNWLERFPEYKGREIYITGESYAGHYVPQLAHTILHRNNQTFINLRGIMIGNPALDLSVETNIAYEFKLNHGLITQEHLDNHKKLCTNNDLTLPSDVDNCENAMRKLDDQTNHMDPYNMLAPVCLNSTISSKPKKCNTIMEVDPCGQNYVEAYLNTKDVQEALHANTTKEPYVWRFINEELGLIWSESDKADSMIPIIHQVMGKGVRVLVYSGDLDLAIPVTSTLAVVKKMNLTVVKEWRRWFNQGQVGGHTEDYKGNFTFASVRGAGHFVPRDQPIRSLALFTSFIRNTPLPLKPLDL